MFEEKVIKERLEFLKNYVYGEINLLKCKVANDSFANCREYMQSRENEAVAKKYVYENYKLLKHKKSVKRDMNSLAHRRFRRYNI